MPHFPSEYLAGGSLLPASRRYSAQEIVIPYDARRALLYNERMMPSASVLPMLISARIIGMIRENKIELSGISNARWSCRC